MVNKKKIGGLAKRYASSYGSRDGSNTSKGGVINYRNHNGDITFFSPAEGKSRINIVPYIIKTKNHPLVKSGEAEIGESDYCLDFYVHRCVGPAEKSVLCLKNTYGKPCPICEHSASLRKAGKEKEANALKPSRRVVYNIEDLKEPGKLKVFETSHYLFEKELIEEARDDDDGGFIDFADIEDGKEIKFRSTKVKKGDMEFMEFKSFSFENRDESLDEKLLDSAISFDELLVVPTYEEVEKILYGDDDEEPEEKKPAKDDSDDEEDEDEDEKPVKKPSRKPTSKEDEEFDRKFDEGDDDEDDEDEEPEEKPAKKSKPVDDDEEDEPPKKSKSKSDDEEDDEEPEEKEKPAKKSKSCDNCPHGHKFGDDCDEYSECDDCDIWHKCVKAHK